MKKAKLFFMILLVAINLLGFSGTSSAFDLSKITSKPVEFIKYIAQKIGFGDDEKEAQEDKTDKILTVKLSTELQNNPESSPGYINLDSYSVDFTDPVFSDKVGHYYVWQDYDEIFSESSSEDWYFRIASGTGRIYSPFAYDPSYSRVWQTKVEYRTDLPWDSFSQLSAELFFESNFSRQNSPESNGLTDDVVNTTYGLSSDNPDYSVRINALVKEAKIGLYGWNGNDTGLLGPDFFYLGTKGASSDTLWRDFNSGYHSGSNNLAATISYDLPFLRSFHQGMSPSVRLETAYRFGTNKPESNNLNEDYDQWKVGVAYKGNNRLDWLNPYGINWGVGYNYTVTLDDLDTMDDLRQRHSSHSGNINANTYWFNMKLYTMFTYLYDRQTRGSMTVFNATYSPDWRWSYGIRANFYYAKNDEDSKALDSDSELVTFTATYRWD